MATVAQQLEQYEPGTVIHINASGLGLRGEIPDTIREFVGLLSLQLQENKIEGQIPRAIAILWSTLKSLNLEDNQLSVGTIDHVGPLVTLTELLLCNNLFIGEIPLDFRTLTRLIELDLSSNHLGGNIPIEIGELVNLRELRLGDNELTGQIPAEIGRLTNLTFLYLDSNILSGELPPELGRLVRLRELVLSDNQFTGQLPVALGALTALQHLCLQGNQFTGEIPVDLYQLTNAYVDIGDNTFDAAIEARVPAGWRRNGATGVRDQLPNDATELELLQQQLIFDFTNA